MKIASEQEMLDFAAHFANDITQQMADSLIIELIGDVGAGKTTFVRGFTKALGIKEPTTSPSFTISKSYAMPNGKTLTHYDFYRLENPGLMAEDLKEKLSENNIVIVEWGNSIQNILPDDRIIIEISKNDDDSRNIDIKNNRQNTTQNKSTKVVSTKQKTNTPSTESEKPSSTKNQDNISKLSLYLDTSTPTTILKLNDKTYEWQSGRDLAENLLKFVHDKLSENQKDWRDLTDITFMSGPGSFTGLRIGAAVVNTLATELNIPLYNHKHEQVKIILPDYGRAANISTPRK